MPPGSPPLDFFNLYVGTQNPVYPIRAKLHGLTLTCKCWIRFCSGPLLTLKNKLASIAIADLFFNVISGHPLWTCIKPQARITDRWRGVDASVLTTCAIHSRYLSTIPEFVTRHRNEAARIQNWLDDRTPDTMERNTPLGPEFGVAAGRDLQTDSNPATWYYIRMLLRGRLVSKWWVSTGPCCTQKGL